jgi:beta-galactosidase
MYRGGDPLRQAGAANLEARIPAPAAWTPETPALYTLVTSLRGPDGEELDHESCRIGFRTIAINAEGVIVLNGQRLVVRGVDRHEHHPEHGRAVPPEHMRAEILAMKRLNFNAVRTSHYPNDPRWLDLCDELGLAVVAETNLETHGLAATLSDDPEWAEAYLERARRMVLRDKNHPAILFWSLGNESGVGPHHAAMAAWIRRYDPTRLVQYESGDPGPDVTDLRVPMYPHLDWVAETLADRRDNRPMVLCEYAYAKGNSSGNVGKFWDMVERFPRFQGGFVWDWADKALVQTTPDGRRFWAYGGDFSEDVVDVEPPMCLNGVVQPDLTPHPGAWEIKHVQAPVRARAKDLAKGLVEILNRHLALDLSHLEIHWTLSVDGLVRQQGVLPAPDVPPGGSADLAIPFTPPDALPQGAETFLDLSFQLAQDLPWAPAGHEIRHDQFPLPGLARGLRPAHAPRRPDGTLAVQETKAGLEIKSTGGLHLTIDRGTGTAVGLSLDGELLWSGPTPNFFRAPTGIDNATGGNGIVRAWRAAGLDRIRPRCTALRAFPLGQREALVETETELGPPDAAPIFRCLMQWRIAADGTVALHHAVTPLSDALPPCPASA